MLFLETLLLKKLKILGCDCGSSGRALA
jgi:hypothetical protein